jgi:nicotinamidase-related amidase
LKGDARGAGCPVSHTVLLLVDFINPLNFPGAEDLAPHALKAAQATAELKRSLCSAGVPVIYANDNYGRWQSDFESLVAHCASQTATSAKIADILYPGKNDLTILKPKHSAFYGSPLGLLLAQMKTEKLIIAGLATDICVQMTAMDGFLRGFRMHVPSDCTAAENPAYKKQALQYMERVCECDTAPSAFIAKAGNKVQKTRGRASR